MTAVEKEERILTFLADAPITCHIIPKETEQNKSKVKAEMTCLASFVEVELTPEQVQAKSIDGDVLISGEAALDPAANLHAGVIANFCIRNGLCPTALAQHGWVGSEYKFPEITLSPQTISLRDFGGETSGELAATLKDIFTKEFGGGPGHATQMSPQGAKEDGIKDASKREHSDPDTGTESRISWMQMLWCNCLDET